LIGGKVFPPSGKLNCQPFFTVSIIFSYDHTLQRCLFGDGGGEVVVVGACELPFTMTSIQLS
jgi:hypothetical protein